MNVYQVWTMNSRISAITDNTPLFEEVYYLVNTKERRVLNRTTDKAQAQAMADHLNTRIVMFKKPCNCKEILKLDAHTLDCKYINLPTKKEN